MLKVPVTNSTPGLYFGSTAKEKARSTVIIHFPVRFDPLFKFYYGLLSNFNSEIFASVLPFSSLNCPQKSQLAVIVGPIYFTTIPLSFCKHNESVHDSGLTACPLALQSYSFRRFKDISATLSTLQPSQVHLLDSTIFDEHLFSFANESSSGYPYRFNGSV